MTTRPGYTGPKRGLADEADHWREYDRQQREAAARLACAWDHHGEQSPLAAAREIAAGIVYAITAICLVTVILAFGFLS